MKPFETYQYLAGEKMTARDKTEVGSKFWNKGKWDNFVLPLLSSHPDNLTLIDIGCNAGLFLSFAEDMGFESIIGVDSNKPAIERGKRWRDKHSRSYQLIHANMEDCLDDLPIADYTILANVHYYFKIDDWLAYLDKLQYKTLNCIIVTTKKRAGNRCWAQSDLESLDSYFRNWIKEDVINPLTTENDPRPRLLWGLKYKSTSIRRVFIDELDSGNHVQDEFYKELDEGKHFIKTKYYKIIRKYRLYDNEHWTESQLNDFFVAKTALYKDIKENGLKIPVIINSKGLILDGNHRCQMLKHLGHKTVFVRVV